jgi:hypothetical protein
MQPILPIADVSEELIRVLNERFRQVEATTAPAPAAASKPSTPATVSIDTDAVQGAGALFTVGAVPRVTTSGAVGQSAITDDGTNVTATGRKLSIVTATANAVAILSTDGVVSTATYNGTAAGLAAGYLGTTSNHPLALFTNNGAAQVTLLQNGNVGIGVNPAYKLDVVGDINTSTVIRVAGTQVVKARLASLSVAAVAAIAGAAGATYTATEQALINALLVLVNNTRTRVLDIETRLGSASGHGLIT